MSATFTGHVCKRCGAESPVGIGYAATAADVTTPRPGCPNPHVAATPARRPLGEILVVAVG